MLVHGTKKTNSLVGMIAHSQVLQANLFLYSYSLFYLPSTLPPFVFHLLVIEKGHAEAKAAGILLKKEGFRFDAAYTSFLRRAVRTLWYALEETDHLHVPVTTSWRLNERHYGALQGLDKQQTVDAYGIDQVNLWRRSYDIPPPESALDSPHYPANDPKYAALPDASIIRAESLKITLDRVLPFWESDIAPQLRSGKTVLVAAHGNSLRALVKHLDGISEKDIAELNIPTAVPVSTFNYEPSYFLTFLLIFTYCYMICT